MDTEVSVPKSTNGHGAMRSLQRIFVEEASCEWLTLTNLQSSHGSLRRFVLESRHINPAPIRDKMESLKEQSDEYKKELQLCESNVDKTNNGEEKPWNVVTHETFRTYEQVWKLFTNDDTKTPFSGPIILFGAEFSYYPISTNDRMGCFFFRSGHKTLEASSWDVRWTRRVAGPNILSSQMLKKTNHSSIRSLMWKILRK